jgi:Flp pilus assembly protein TadD
LLRQAQHAHPADFWLNTQVGSTLSERDKAAEAEGFYRAALALRPDTANAWNNLAAALGAQGKLAEAEKLIRHAIHLDPNHPLAYNNLGVVLFDRGDPTQAEKYLRHAIHLDSRYSRAHCNLGLVMERQGKPAEAEKHHRQAIHLDPRSIFAHKHLCRLLELQGNWAEAASVARKARARGLDIPMLRAGLPRWQRLARLGPQLPAFLVGQRRPAGNEDRLALAQLCQLQRLYAASVRFSADAFAADARLAGDLTAAHRYNSACSAALAGCGKGGDAATLEDREKARLRGLALTWLGADLVLWRRLLDSGKDADRLEVLAQMRHWQQDSDLAGVRGEQALAALPQAERKAWAKLWRDVAALLDRAGKK